MFVCVCVCESSKQRQVAATSLQYQIKHYLHNPSPKSSTNDQQHYEHDHDDHEACMHKYFSKDTYIHTWTCCSCAVLEHVRTPVAQCRSALPLTPVPPLPLTLSINSARSAAFEAPTKLQHPQALDAPVRLLCCSNSSTGILLVCVAAVSGALMHVQTSSVLVSLLLVVLLRSFHILLLFFFYVFLELRLSPRLSGLFVSLFMLVCIVDFQ